MMSTGVSVSLVNCVLADFGQTTAGMGQVSLDV